MAVATLPSASTSEGRLGTALRPSQGAGSCRVVFMMDMHVDVHIGKWTQDTASVIAFDQAQFGQHLHISEHPLDVAAGSPGQFAHRNRALPQHCLLYTSPSPRD